MLMLPYCLYCIKKYLLIYKYERIRTRYQIPKKNIPKIPQNSIWTHGILSRLYHSIYPTYDWSSRDNLWLHSGLPDYPRKSNPSTRSIRRSIYSRKHLFLFRNSPFLRARRQEKEIIIDNRNKRLRILDAFSYIL